MISDESLAIDTLNGDLIAFEELVNRYKNRVFSIVYRMMGQYQEAEDVTQEVFINVYEKLYQFDAEKKFAPWIYRIASNTSISALRKKKNIVVVDFDDVQQVAYENSIAGESYNPQHLYEREELKGLIEEAIMELPENYRMVIMLRYQMDLDNQEIANVLDISKENIEVRIHRARKALRQIMQKRWEERGMANELPASR